MAWQVTHFKKMRFSNHFFKGRAIAHICHKHWYFFLGSWRGLGTPSQIPNTLSQTPNATHHLHQIIHPKYQIYQMVIYAVLLQIYAHFGIKFPALNMSWCGKYKYKVWARCLNADNVWHGLICLVLYLYLHFMVIKRNFLFSSSWFCVVICILYFRCCICGLSPGFVDDQDL